MSSMIQIFQDWRNGRLMVAEVPVPQIRPNRILVRNHFSLVSFGTERQMMDLGRPDLGKGAGGPAKLRGALDGCRVSGSGPDAPVPLGYSCAGEVMAVGEGVERVNVGDRVACAGCTYACHAEVVSIPRTLFVVVPETVDCQNAAFVALGGMSLHAIRLSGAAVGETVAVIGLGLVGLLAVQILKAAGCLVIGMDPNGARCALAKELGCDFAATSSELAASIAEAQTARHGCDASIIFAAVPDDGPVELAAHMTRSQGRVIAAGLVGLKIPRPLFYEKELQLRVARAWGPGLYDPGYEEGRLDYPYPYVRWTAQGNMKSFIDLLARGKVEPGKLISHRFAIRSAEDAYKMAAAGGKSCTGVVLSYPGGAWRNAAPKLSRPGGPVRRPAQAVSSSGKIYAGFIGAGNFSRAVLLPAMRRFANLHLRGVANASGPSARAVGDRFGFDFCTTDHRELLDDRDISSIFIATPNGSHASLVAEALKAGKHVFVEKPLAICEEQLRTVVQAYNGAHGPGGANAPAAAGQKILVGFNRRFSPLAGQIKELLGAEGLPMVINCRVNAGFLPLERWEHDPEVGGGRIIGEICHFFDLVQFITGGLPVRVFAMRMRACDRFCCADNVVIDVEMSEGSVAAISYASCGDRSYSMERVEVFRGGSVAVIDDFRSARFINDGRRRTVKKWLRPDRGHNAELEAFLCAVSGVCDRLPAFESLVATTLATFAVEKSLREGRPCAVGAAEFLGASGWNDIPAFCEERK